MQKVVTINLNGNAYQLDETAYDALRAYLDHAEVQLADNPDRTEIVADLEQAIAEKCHKCLSPNKTVVTAAEMEQIVKEMGPVEGADDHHDASGEKATGSGGQTSTGSAPKRLYQIREGAMLSGVCTGLAAYFGVDVTLVRIIFVAIALATFGWGVLLYLGLAVAIPHADTSEERAAAHGQPFNAQELIDQAKKQYADFKDHGEEWKQQWREQQRRWRAQQRQWRQQWRQTIRGQRWGGSWSPGAHPAAYATQVWAGLMMPVFSLISLAFFLFLAFSIFSLVNSGGIFGWALPAAIPVWAGILILVVVYHVVTSPIRAARHLSYYAGGAPTAGSRHGMGSSRPPSRFSCSGSSTCTCRRSTTCVSSCTTCQKRSEEWAAMSTRGSTRSSTSSARSVVPVPLLARRTLPMPRFRHRSAPSCW